MLPTHPRPAPTCPHRAAAVVLGGLWPTLVAGACVAPLSAQSSRPAATASVEASLGLSALHEKATWMASTTALIGVTPRAFVGGGGTVTLGSRSLPGSTPGNDVKLRMAFGGLVGQLELARRDDRALWLRILAGAGNAKMDLALVGTQIASDNFGVLVPEIGAAVHLVGPLRAGGALGYRATFGVEDLPGLASSDLRGFSARLLIAVHRF